MFGVDAILALVVAILGAVAAYWNRDKIKAKVNKLRGKGGDSESPSTNGTEGTSTEGATDSEDPGNLLSRMIDKIAAHPLLKRLDVSRDSVVRTFLSFMLIKLTEYIRKENFPQADKDKAFDALTFLSGLITVKQSEPKEEIPPPPPPAPPAPPVEPPAPPKPETPVL